MEGMQEHTVLPELQEILDREVLNRKGGIGNKGGHAPMNPRNSKGKVTTLTKATH